ncbi:MAG: efflux RND transporter periplasmic adaptor subunit [Betaproteobacteria bacterium]|nr:efflux RND transporter periplasmic adaptor subunit [Betaproteobacteria bacterium]
MKKLWFLLPLLALGILLGIWGGKRKSPQTVSPEPPAYVAAQGRVEALPGFDVNVGTGELNGKVESILVSEGQSVRAGQVVAVLQNRDLKAAVNQAAANLALAQSQLADLEAGARPQQIKEAAAALQGAKAVLDEAARQVVRYRELRREGMVSPAALDKEERAFRSAQAAVEEAAQREKLLRAGPKPQTVTVYRNKVELARAQLDYARALLGKTLIRSPISGVVIQRYVEPGEGVTPEIPIVDVADLNKIWVNAEVDETDIGKVVLGEPVRITSDAYPGRVFRGRVAQIADYVGVRKVRPSNPAVNLGLKVAQVKVALLEKTPLKLGMTVDTRMRAAP